MKYETKLSLQIFTLGTIVLIIGYFIVYKYSYSEIIQIELKHTNSIVNELSVDFEQRLLEKVKTNRTLSITPTIKTELIESNNIYSKYSDKERDEKISYQNNKWKTIKNKDDAFILEFTNNDIAKFLKEQQKNLPGEYGEIFLTNKYGVIIAATSKLTTLAHAHKYWWKGACNDGIGTVFFDDRGYDESVGGYVLGIVIPIKENNEIIGILKVNLNILGSISEMLTSSQYEDVGEFKLIRSGGEIIFDNKNKPLFNRIPDILYKRLQVGNNEPFIFQDSTDNCMAGVSEIKITSKNVEGFRFGGSFESIDHVKGNTGESWFIIYYRNLDTILKPLNDLTRTILGVGISLIIILAIAAFLLGKKTTKPLKLIIEQSKKVAKADFSAQINVTRKDEIGLLGQAFNKMTNELNQNTTSIKNLESEISHRLKTEQDLKESEIKLRESNQTKDKFFSIVAHDLKSPFTSMLGFSQLLTDNFDEYNDKDKLRFIQIINQALQNTSKLLENLLYWSRSLRGTIDFKFEKVNLFLLVNETIELFRQIAENKSIKLMIQISEDLYLYADKSMLSTIIRNLLSNAIKFTPKSGKVKIEAQISKSDDEFVEIIVNDTGVGISKEIQSKLFDIGEDISTKGTDNESGTGLGLILCKEFVEKHGGIIWVESEIGKGSSFCFTIPRDSRK